MKATRIGMRWNAQGSVAVPFPEVEKTRKPLSRQEFLDTVDATEPTSVPIEGLHATQPSLDPETVKEFMRGRSVPKGKRSAGGLLIDHPVIVRAGGVNMIWDGHHRCASLKQHGAKTVMARFLDLDKLTETRVSASPLVRWAAAASQRA